MTRHRDWLWRRGNGRLTVIFDREISITEKLTGLDRETDRNLGATVHNLKDMVANQTAELASGSLLGNQLNPAIAGVTLRTDEVGLSHVRYRTMFVWIAHSVRDGPAASLRCSGLRGAFSRHRITKPSPK